MVLWWPDFGDRSLEFDPVDHGAWHIRLARPVEEAVVVVEGAVVVDVLGRDRQRVRPTFAFVHLTQLDGIVFDTPAQFVDLRVTG